ncbi:monofunctional biosynthetic peptidoglycan transglycosylase [Hyphomicrobium sp.]|jgi:monofunctional biosynthetic peptidoglycan transglycosylase|uniref:monofunctional biosynthetic peptidoglycan transglycosylase n=1 Tax=Hyphomicrobium sp. TaxID=82 RepID=UPI00356A82D3
MDRPDETSGLSAAPTATLSENKPAATAAAPNAVQNAMFERPPPRPLPPRAFFPTPSAAPSSTVDDTAPALTPGPEPLSEVEPHAEPAPELALEPAPEPTIPDGPLSADMAFSAIDAEVSSRSLFAVETAATDTAAARALREIKPHKPIEISELVLPAPTPFASPDLGHTIPQRMLEPRLEIAPPPQAFERLRIDPSMQRGIPLPVEEDKPQVVKPPPARNYWAVLKRGVRLLAWIAIGWLALVLALIVAYRFVDPPASTLMLRNWLTGQDVVQKWVPFEQISPNVVRAVLLSEDGRFCQHSGIDLEAIENAIENIDGRSRGGSTISMQVVKNLFLWPSKSYIRKAIELPLTFVMELIWTKRRIMEVYLNIVEWGPGIFGIGAAAAYHFDKPARNLSVRDAARLAVSLPNPLERNAGRPGPGLQRLANAIQVRMRLAPSSQLACVLSRSPY